MTGRSEPSNPRSGRDAESACDDPAQSCPLQDQVVLVELVEEVQYGGDEHRQVLRGRRQYVNLDPSAADGPHFDYGRVLNLRARLRWRSGDQSRSLAGRDVYWEATPDSGNRTGLIQDLTHGFNSNGSGTLRRPSQVDAEGWTPVVRFHTSICGGDRFKVRATEQSDYSGGIETGTVTIWRQLYYELDCMSRASGGGTYADALTRADLEQAFRDRYVELAGTGADSRPAHQRILRNTEVGTWTGRIRTGTGAPRFFHLALVDEISKNPQSVPVGPSTLADPGDPVELAADTYSLDSRDWLVSAEYRQPAGSGAWMALASGDVPLTEEGSPVTNDDRFLIRFSFPATVNAGQAVEVRLQVKNWTDLSGLQSGSSVIVGMRWRERLHRNDSGNLRNSTLNTAIHEPAHFTGLTAQTLPDGTNNASYYFQNGGHCNNDSNRCLMYHANSTSTALCDTCGDCLRARNLSSLPIRGTATYTG